MLVGLVLLPVGTGLLERVARVRSAAVKVIRVDAAKTDDSDEVELGGGQPLDADHAKARDATRRGDIAGAIIAYEALAAHYPTSTVVAVERGGALLQAKKTLDAITVLQTAKEASPTDEKIAVVLARAQLKHKDLAAAEVELRRALALRPGYTPALRTLGRVLQSAGKKVEAIDIQIGRAHV